jgi:hypothetical protein
VLLGKTPASKTPWPISGTRRAIDALRGDRSKIEIPDIVAALKDTQRRHEWELCAQLRLRPSGFAAYDARCSAEPKPLRQTSMSALT